MIKNLSKVAIELATKVYHEAQGNASWKFGEFMILFPFEVVLMKINNPQMNWGEYTLMMDSPEILYDFVDWTINHSWSVPAP